MDKAKLPSCHNYPPSDTVFQTMEQFGKFRKFFCHMRNANFHSYNNSVSAVYICPNYRKCRGVLHGFRSKDLAEDDKGNPIYDKNGYLKYEKLPHFIIGPLTNPCDCAPKRYTTIEDSSEIFRKLLHTENVSRTEFTHLANSYLAVAGKGSYEFSDTGYQLSWRCTLCRNGCLRLTMNRNPAYEPSRYQSYGTITCASACTSNCASRNSPIAPKTIWLPKSHAPDEMAVTATQIETKKHHHTLWVKEARDIAQELLTKQQIRKKPWKLEHKSEEQYRNRISNRKAKISQSSKKRQKPTAIPRTDPPTQSNSHTIKIQNLERNQERETLTKTE